MKAGFSLYTDDALDRHEKWKIKDENKYSQSYYYPRILSKETGVFLHWESAKCNTYDKSLDDASPKNQKEMKKRKRRWYS